MYTMKACAIFVDPNDVSQTGKYTSFLVNSLESIGVKVVKLVKDTDVNGDSWFVADLVVVASRIPTATEVATIQSRKKSLVYLIASDPVVADVERFSYATNIPVNRIDFIRSCDSIWLTNNFTNHLSYVETMYKRPVKVVPNLWDDSFSTPPMTYTPKANAPLDIVILDSNTSFNTSCWKQLVICEQLYLQNPNTIHQVFLFNTPESNPTSMGMIRSLTLKKDGKIRIFKALPVGDIVNFFLKSDKNTVFLGNQVFDDMPYNYYDILNAGFPFVHSSSMLKSVNVGLYYDTLDIQAAVNQLQAKAYNVEANLVANRTFLRSLRLADTSAFD